MKKSSVNKKVGVFVLALVVLTISLTFISAQIEPVIENNNVGGDTNFQVAGRNIAGFVNGLFESIKLDPGEGNFTVILMGILLWMILYSVVSQIGLFKDSIGKGGFLWTGGISLILTILAFMFLPENFIGALATPIAATGATILTFIPFIIVIYFTIWVTDSLIIGRAIWIVFLIYYLSLFVYQVGIATEGIFIKANVPYFVAMFIGIIIFVMLRQLRFWIHEGKIQAIEEKVERNVKKAGVGLRGAGKVAEEFSEGGGI